MEPTKSLFEIEQIAIPLAGIADVVENALKVSHIMSGIGRNSLMKTK